MWREAFGWTGKKPSGSWREARPLCRNGEVTSPVLFMFNTLPHANEG